jgi:hypothetical protein
MRDCWQFKPERRPSFASLGDQLGTMLEESVRQVSKLNTLSQNMTFFFFNLFIKHISVLLHIFTESAYYILKNYILKKILYLQIFTYMSNMTFF